MGKPSLMKDQLMYSTKITIVSLRPLTWAQWATWNLKVIRGPSHFYKHHWIQVWTWGQKLGLGSWNNDSATWRLLPVTASDLKVALPSTFRACGDPHCQHRNLNQVGSSGGNKLTSCTPLPSKDEVRGFKTYLHCRLCSACLVRTALCRLNKMVLCCDSCEVPCKVCELSLLINDWLSQSYKPLRIAFLSFNVEWSVIRFQIICQWLQIMKQNNIWIKMESCQFCFGKVFQPELLIGYFEAPWESLFLTFRTNQCTKSFTKFFIKEIASLGTKLQALIVFQSKGWTSDIITAN